MCVLALLFGAACSLREPPPRPNIVLIIVDDQGYEDFGFMGSDTARTPRMDALASEGVVFTHGFNTSSACRPSLQTLLTGLTPLRFDARANQLRQRQSEATADAQRDEEIVAQMQTLPRLVAREGYRSFQAGKFWEATYRHAGFSAGMKTELHDSKGSMRQRLRRAAGGESLAFGRESLEPMWRFIDARGEAPFLIWFAPMLPHGPHDAPPEFAALYDGEHLSPSALGYFANISRLDARIGELVDGLAARGLRDDTLLVLLSDNGWHQERDVDYADTRLGGGPRAKFSLYEAGFRTPVVFSWPARLERGQGHRQLSELVSTEDVFTTLLDVLEIPAPPGREGISLWPVLRGAPGPHRRVMIASMDVGGMLRDPKWSFVWHAEGGETELFAVAQDSGQLNDVAAEHPAVVESFRREIVRWRRNQGKPL